MFVKVHCWEGKQRGPGCVSLVVKEVRVGEEQREGEGSQVILLLE